MKRTEMRRFSLSSCWSTPADSSSDKLSAASPTTLTTCESVEARSLECNRKIILPSEVSFVEGGNFNGCIYDSMKNHSRSQDTKLSQQFPYPSSPPTIAESVTHSEFENLFQSNQSEQSANHDRKIATCVSLSESEESLLTDLVRNQLTVLNLCDDTDTLQQVITCLANGHGITDSDDEHVISLTSNKAIPAPTNVRQTYFKECFEPIHNSLSEKNNSLPAKYCKNKETDPETIYKRWSVCERPNAGQVAQVKSAWEHYFNPSSRSSQASLKSSGMNGTCYSKLEASDKAKPNSSSQTDSENSTHGTLLHAPTNASRMYKAKEQRDAKVFSTIGSLDEFILMPASGLLATYFNHNRGDMKSTPYDLPCETDEPQRSISTDSVARISDISSSTITLSDNRTPTEEFPGTINSIALTELKTNMFGELLPVTQAQLEADALQPHRSRNISKPAMTRRPLSITVQRHRIRASRSPTFTSPNQDWLSDPMQLLVKPLGNVIAHHAQQEVHTLAVQTAVRERPAGVEDRTFDQSEEAALFNQLPSISPTESAAKFTASRLRRRVTVHTYTGQANLGTTNGLSVDSGRHDFPTVPSLGTNAFRLSNGFRDNNVERHVRSLSATTVPKLNSEPQVLVQSTNIIRMQSTNCDADKPSVAVQRANRCRGIYKKSFAQGQNADSISGLTKSSETIIEPAVVKATVLSSAAQRYEQHVQALVAKRHHDTQLSPLWQSKPFREEQADVKITPEDRRLLSDQQFGLQEPKLAYETVQAETDDMATTDPEAWQDKLGLITRWQYEVNNAMRARETDVDDLMPSSDSCSCSLNPPSDPSTIRNDNSALSGHPSPCLPPIYRTGEVISFLTPLRPYQIHAPTTNYQATVHMPVEPTREYDNFPCEYRAGYGELTNSYQSDLQPSVGASPPFYKNGKFTKTITGEQEVLTPLTGPSSCLQLHSIGNRFALCPTQTAYPESPRSPSVEVITSTGLCQLAPTTSNHLAPTSDSKFRPTLPMAFTSLALHTTEAQQVSSTHQTAMNTAGQPGNLFYPTEPGYTCAPGPVVPHGHDRSHKFNGMEHSNSFYGNNGQPTSRMCNSISNSLSPLTSMSPFGVVKPSESRDIGPFPIYEGMENWSRFDNLTGVQWTRVPSSRTNRVNWIATNKQSLPSSKPPGMSELYTLSRPTTEHDLDRGRRRSVTRLQLSIPKPATADTMFTSFSSSTTRNMDISVNQPSDNTTSMVKRRTNLRRATTISPIRRRAEPVTSVEATHTHGQLASSSGFASAGSITVAIEDAMENRHRPPVPLPTDETENRAVDSGLPPPVDVHAYPFVSDLRKGMDQPYQTALNTSGQLGDLPKVSKEVAFKESTVQLPTSSKFLLGRVASNDDICIRTETPFALTIAATENEISITKVSSVSNLKQLDEERTVEPLNSRETQTRIRLVQASRRPVPVLLRLTFGSESNLICDDTSPSPNKVPQYRATCYLDLPCGSKVTASKNQVIEPTHSKATNNPFRHSLPCIPYRADQQRPTGLKS